MTAPARPPSAPPDTPAPRSIRARITTPTHHSPLPLPLCDARTRSVSLFEYCHHHPRPPALYSWPAAARRRLVSLRVRQPAICAPSLHARIVLVRPRFVVARSCARSHRSYRSHPDPDPDPDALRYAGSPRLAAHVTTAAPRPALPPCSSAAVRPSSRGPLPQIGPLRIATPTPSGPPPIDRLPRPGSTAHRPDDRSVPSGARRDHRTYHTLEGLGIIHSGSQPSGRAAEAASRTGEETGHFFGWKSPQAACRRPLLLDRQTETGSGVRVRDSGSCWAALPFTLRGVLRRRKRPQQETWANTASRLVSTGSIHPLLLPLRA